MNVKNVFVGKADWGYFVDLQCDDTHTGKECACDNIAIVEYKKDALRIGKEKAKELDVPLFTDWD